MEKGRVSMNRKDGDAMRECQCQCLNRTEYEREVGLISHSMTAGALVGSALSQLCET